MVIRRRFEAEPFSIDLIEVFLRLIERRIGDYEGGGELACRGQDGIGGDGVIALSCHEMNARFKEVSLGIEHVDGCALSEERLVPHPL